MRTSLCALASWFRLGALSPTDARQHLAQDAIKRPPPSPPSMGHGAGKRADCAAGCARTRELVGRGVARVGGASAAAAAAAAALVRRRIRQRRQRLLGRRCAAQHRLLKLARPGSWSYHRVVAKCTASDAAWAVLNKDCKIGKRERTAGPNADRLWLQPVSLTTRAVPQHAGALHAHQMAGTARARQGRAAPGRGRAGQVRQAQLLELRVGQRGRRQAGRRARGQDDVARERVLREDGDRAPRGHLRPCAPADARGPPGTAPACNDTSTAVPSTTSAQPTSAPPRQAGQGSAAASTAARRPSAGPHSGAGLKLPATLLVSQAQGRGARATGRRRACAASSTAAASASRCGVMYMAAGAPSVHSNASQVGSAAKHTCAPAAPARFCGRRARRPAPASSEPRRAPHAHWHGRRLETSEATCKGARLFRQIYMRHNPNPNPI